MISNNSKHAAPPLQISQWFNTNGPLTLEELRGKVVVLEAFQMLCPGCVSHGLPQAQNIAAAFSPDNVCVIGLHTVFEHHTAMTPVSLRAFIHEYRLTFPIGVDEVGTGAIPKTMSAYGLRGTPSLIIIDKRGYVRANHFGQVPDLQIGAEIATLLSQANDEEASHESSSTKLDGCDDEGCSIPEKK